jgi:hypothetical protein
MDEVNVMTNGKTREIGVEQDVPASTVVREKYVIPVPAISRRTFFAGGTARRCKPAVGSNG